MKYACEENEIKKNIGADNMTALERGQKLGYMTYYV